MNLIGKVIIFGMLLFTGCLSTVPVVPRLDLPVPLADVPQQLPPPPPPPILEAPAISLPVLEAATLVAEPLETIPLEEDIALESEVAPLITLDEQADLLVANDWVKNIALINYLDTGKRPNRSLLNSTDRQRRDAINRLNMSREELAKRDNIKYEYVDGSASDWRWMHSGVDKLVAAGQEQREDTEAFLRNHPKYKEKQYKILRMNAAILLGREGNPAVQKYLLQLVQSGTTPLPFRCAAAEVLGRLSSITADDLIPLLETVKDRDIKIIDKKTGEPTTQYQSGNIDVWEELLLALSEKIDPWEHRCFLEPLQASTYDIRLAAAKIWRRKSLERQTHSESSADTADTILSDSSPETLPERFLEIVQQEGNPLMRVEFIRTLGAWNVPNLYDLLKYDMQHRIAEVRNAAMLALSDAQSREAIPLIKDQLRDSNGQTRAAAVSSLRKLGELDEVFKLMNDTDRHVRLEIASAFAERCTPQTVSIAKSFLADRDSKVQSVTLEAVSGWSIEESGPLLLIAAKSFHSSIRCRAVEILAERGVETASFDPEDKPENQSKQFGELLQVFRESTGIDPDLESIGNVHSARQDSALKQVSAISPEDSALAEVRHCLNDWQDRSASPDQRELIERRLASHGQQLMSLIDYLMTEENRNIPESLDTVFAKMEPMFKQMDNVRSHDLATQRRGASELARLGTMNTPSKLISKRIVNLAAHQTDPLVLVSLLTALKNADPETVCQLARPLLQSESVEVRRLSCEMLKQFGTSADVELLHDALTDSSPTVVRGALTAVDALLAEGEVTNAPVITILKSMLMRSDPMIQVDVAATLHRLGLPEGEEAMRRLAAAGDVRVKAHVASTVANLGDSVFTPILTRFLDDGNATVRNKALEGLPKLAGRDVGFNSRRSPEIAPSQDRLDRWRNWGKGQSERSQTN